MKHERVNQISHQSMAVSVRSYLGSCLDIGFVYLTCFNFGSWAWNFHQFQKKLGWCRYRNSEYSLYNSLYCPFRDFEEMIEYKNVNKSYGNQDIIKNLNLKIEDGTFLTVVGTSGSGKTTLLKMINGLVKPNQGQILINGQDVQDTDLIELRRNIGYSIQGNGLFPHLTVAENIAYVLNLQKKNQVEIEKVVDEKLAMLGLDTQLKNRYPAALSGGQAQRVGIARALAATPNILLMDEPFGAVDAITRYQLQRELKLLHAETGITVVFITHDIAEALKLGTKILVLDKGEIQQYGTPQEIKMQPANDFVRKLLELAS